MAESKIPAEYLRESWPAGAQLVAQLEQDICAVARDPDDSPTMKRLAEQLEACNRGALETWNRLGRVL